MLIGALVFLVGLAVGSFLNVVVLRTRAGRSFVGGRSECTVCSVALAPIDLVPLVSYVLLAGKCRSCRTPISIQYPLVEFFTGVLFLAMFLHDGLSPLFARDLVFVSFLVVIFLYDLRYMEIPDRFTIPAMAVALAANVWLGNDIVSLIWGAVAAGGFFFLQYVISRGRWVGGGDVRMGMVMGFMLGLSHGLAALFVAYLIGAAYAVGLLVAKKANGKTAVPFGTFLAVATVVALLWGENLVAWYLGLMS